VGQREEFFNPKQDTVRHTDDPESTVDFRGEKRSNQTHESKTDPGALLARKAQAGGVELREMLCGESQRIDCIELVWEPRAKRSAMRQWPCCRSSGNQSA